MSTEIKYALRHKKTKKLAKYDETSNAGSDFCGETTVTISGHGSRTWYADYAVEAEYVRLHGTPWYNSDLETPHHCSTFKSDEYEVVRIQITTETEPVDIKLPTKEEYWEWSYGPNGPYPNPGHLKYLQTIKGASYPSLCEMFQFFRELGLYH